MLIHTVGTNTSPRKVSVEVSHLTLEALIRRVDLLDGNVALLIKNTTDSKVKERLEAVGGHVQSLQEVIEELVAGVVRIKNVHETLLTQVGKLFKDFVITFTSVRKR